MSFIIGLLMLVLVLVCVALIFLVLIQLPKKDAGAGLAFGGGASDALFGAGSGTVLTKATKYMAIAFFVLAFGVGILQSRNSDKHRGTKFGQNVNEKASQIPNPAAPAAPAPAPTQTAPVTAPVVIPAPVAAPSATN